MPWPIVHLSSVPPNRIETTAAACMDAYHIVITVTQIAWFIDFIAFLYGIYKFPLHQPGA